MLPINMVCPSRNASSWVGHRAIVFVFPNGVSGDTVYADVNAAQCTHNTIAVVVVVVVVVFVVDVL